MGSCQNISAESTHRWIRFIRVDTFRISVIASEAPHSAIFTSATLFQCIQWSGGIVVCQKSTIAPWICAHSPFRGVDAFTSTPLRHSWPLTICSLLSFSTSIAIAIITRLPDKQLLLSFHYSSTALSLKRCDSQKTAWRSKTTEHWLQAQSDNPVVMNEFGTALDLKWRASKSHYFVLKKCPNKIAAKSKAIVFGNEMESFTCISFHLEPWRIRKINKIKNKYIMCTSWFIISMVCVWVCLYAVWVECMICSCLNVESIKRI